LARRIRSGRLRTDRDGWQADGIGSLILQQGDAKGRRLDMNMVVPIGLLGPILKDLLTFGRVNRPARPWLGMYATESGDSIVVGGLSETGPAAQADCARATRY